MRERWLALGLVAAWAASLVAVWIAFTAVAPPAPANPSPVSARTEVRTPEWTLEYQATTRNATAFGHLREASVVLAFELEYVGYGWPYEDAFVTAINGTRNDEGQNMYWQFCVNGKYAEVGAMHQVLRDGDVVRWLYDEPGGDELCG